MQFRNPLIFIIGAAAVALMCVLLYVIARHRAFKKGVRAVYFEPFRKHALFRRTARSYRITGLVSSCLLLTAVLATLTLLARPYRTQTVNQGTRKRDIFLCMDVGVFISTLNEELLEEMISLVDGLQGDRFGISLYNASSLVYVPMSDDYDYVKKKLRDLQDYFRLVVKLDQEYGAYARQGHREDLPDCLPEDMRDDYEADYERYLDVEAEFKEATYLNSETRGDFLVGDGLTSCMLCFPRFGAEDRSRVVLLSTMGERGGVYPLVTLEEACDMCARNSVTVFGLFRGKKAYEQAGTPNYVFLRYSSGTAADYDAAKSHLRTQVEKTGGLVYEYGESSVQEIVDEIQKQEAMQVYDVIVRKEIDQPFLPAAVLMFSLTGLALCAALRGA